MKSINYFQYIKNADIISYNKNKANKLRNKNDEYYFKLCRKKNTPILGICYGAQFIAKKFNSEIIKKKTYW